SGDVAPTFSRSQWTISDLLLGMLGCAVILAIGKRSMTLTDVSGMYDPWETIEFAAFGMPIFLLVRLPLLLLALFVHAMLWTAIVRIILRNDKLTASSMAFSLTLYAALSIAEFVLSSAILLYQKPWPLLPLTMNPGVNFFQILSVQLEENRDLS